MIDLPTVIRADRERYQPKADMQAIARELLAALEVVRIRWLGPAYRSPTWNELYMVEVAICRAKAAGI